MPRLVTDPTLRDALAKLQAEPAPSSLGEVASTLASPIAKQYAAAGVPRIANPDDDHALALSYPERVVAAIYAEKALKAQESGIKTTFESIAKAGAKADALGPEIAQRMALPEEDDLLDRAVSRVSAAVRAIPDAINVVGSQLDRPINFITGGASALQRGGSFTKGAFDAANYGLVEEDTPNARMVRMLDRAGWVEGPNYGPPAMRALQHAIDAITPGNIEGDWGNYAPKLTGRDLLAFSATLAIDPITWTGIGPSSDAARIATGPVARYLNKTGRTARSSVEKLVQLTNPEAAQWFASRGMHGMTAVAERATEVLKHIENNPAAITRSPAVLNEIERHHKTLNEAIRRAILTDPEGVVPPWVDAMQYNVPTPMTPNPTIQYTASRVADEIIEKGISESEGAAGKIAALRKNIAAKNVPELMNLLGEGHDIREFPKLVASAQDTIDKLAKKLVQWEDPGGLRIGNTTIIPGKPVRAAVKNAATSAYNAIPGNAGGLFVKTQIDNAGKIIDSIGKALSVAWRVPADFMIDLRERYLGPMLAVQTHAARKLQDIFTVIDPERNIKRLTTLEEGIAITNAVDQAGATGGKSITDLLRVSPHLDQVLAKMQLATDELAEGEILRDIITRPMYDKYRGTYIYHYIKNPELVEKHLSKARSKRSIVRASKDPSSYQRMFDTIAEGEAAIPGLQYEKDAFQLFGMRFVNAHRAMIKHDFLAAMKEGYGDPTESVVRKLMRKHERRATKAGKELVASGQKAFADADAATRAEVREKLKAIRDIAETGNLKKPLKMSELLESGLVRLDNPTDYEGIASRLVGDGKTSTALLSKLPEPLQREFLRQRFLLGYTRKGGQAAKFEIPAIEKKYSAFSKLFPKGSADDILADSLGLPRVDRSDGKYRVVHLQGHGDYFFPSRIADKLEEIDNRALFTPTGQPVRTLLGYYERLVLNRFRPMSTQYFPSFHFRNLVTSQIQTASDIGLSVLNPQTRADAAAVMRGTKGYVIKLKDGNVTSAEQLRKEYVQLGGWNTFQHRLNIGTANDSQAIVNNVRLNIEANPLHPQNILNNPLGTLANTGSLMGSWIENKVRTIHYVALRKDGLSATDAMHRMLKFQFDYANGLTPTEQQFLRTVFPFWSWAKNNTLLQAELAVTKPVILQSWRRFVDAVSDDTNAPERPIVERGLLPQHLRNEFGVRVSGDTASHMSRYLMATDMPQADLNGLWTGDLAGTLQHWRDQIGPAPDIWEGLMRVGGIVAGTPATSEDYAKAQGALQLLKGTRIAPIVGLRERIDQRTGRAVLEADKGKLKFLITLTMLDRFLRETGRFVDKKDSFWAAAAQTLTGAHYEDFDPAEEMAVRISKALGSVGADAADAGNAADLALIERGVGQGANPLGPPSPLSAYIGQIPNSSQHPGQETP